MFTGLVMGMGEVLRSIPGQGESRFVFRPLFSAPDWQKGESVAVNGACLSVESFDPASFTAYASRETLSRTNLGALRPGTRVNLERAMTLGGRLGGHLVSGHIDGLAELEALRRDGSSLFLRVRFPEEFSDQVISKGSVALDGVSLTVNACGPGFLEVNVIPETLSATTVSAWTAGRRLNFESDMIAKYVRRMLDPWREKERGGLTLDFLRANDFQGSTD